jgi:WD40 repeat protein
VADVVAALK